VSTGLGRGWTMAPADVAGAGDMVWATTAGVPPGHPLVQGLQSSQAGGPGWDVDAARGLVVTQDIDAPRPGANMGGAADVFDDWRDLFDFRNSPAPWVLLAVLAMIGLVAMRVEVRGGPANIRAALG